MNDEAPESLIPYDEIVQEALRAVVGRVLGEIPHDGMLPAGHHFYITFKTQASGVSIPAALIARYPDEMTIVLQNKFWDLKVHDDAFEVSLTFGGVPSKLVVPFSAITLFRDPAVEFALQFHVDAANVDAVEQDAADNDAPLATPVEDGSNVVAVDFKRKK